MTCHNTILFLGSGATVGSEIKRDDKVLPSDGNFFNLLPDLIPNWKDLYPTLHLYRSLRNSNLEKSLYQTWNDLFIFRGLAQAGVIKEMGEVKNKFYDLANHDWPSNNEYRSSHYHYQFQIMESRFSFEYYLAELAIWDLRVLVKEIYSGELNSKKVYPNFWRKINERYSDATVINFNYDTTFDDSPDEVFYFPGKQEPKDKKFPLIRPHGSLKWTSQSLYSKTKNTWDGWTENYIDTPLQEVGFSELAKNLTKLSFKQPLIVTPAIFKEEIIGNSSFPGLSNPILRLQWNNLEIALRNSNHWIFIGFSFASGDDHLKYLLKTVSMGKRVCCSIYDKDLTPVINLSSFLGIQICRHFIDEGNSINEFFNQNNITNCVNPPG